MQIFLQVWQLHQKMERVPGKLEVVAAVLGVKRTGKGHQAASDTLLMPSALIILYFHHLKKILCHGHGDSLLNVERF